LTAYLLKAPRHIIGGLAAFGAGALIAAVALDLVPEAKHMDVSRVAFWMLAGAAMAMT
jgi:zinc transporter ZupT